MFFDFIFAGFRKITSILKGIGKFFGFGKKTDINIIEHNLSDTARGGQGSVVSPAPTAPAAAGVSNNVSNTSNTSKVNQNIKIDVKSDNPEAVAAVVDSKLRTWADSATENFGNGGF